MCDSCAPRRERVKRWGERKTRAIIWRARNDARMRLHKCRTEIDPLGRLVFIEPGNGTVLAGFDRSLQGTWSNHPRVSIEHGRNHRNRVKPIVIVGCIRMPNRTASESESIDKQNSRTSTILCSIKRCVKSTCETIECRAVSAAHREYTKLTGLAKCKSIATHRHRRAPNAQMSHAIDVTVRMQLKCF